MATSQTAESPPSATVTPENNLVRKRKRSIDDTLDSAKSCNKSNKRRSCQASEFATEFVTALEVPDTHDVLPDPEKDWGDHRWQSNVVSKLVASSTEMIALVPQGKDRKFFVHKELLCYYSPYYRDLLNPTSKDGIREWSFVVKATQSALALFTKWLYTRDLTPPDDAGDFGPDLMDLYLFATSTLTLALRRDIMNAVHSTHRSWLVGYDMLEYMYCWLPTNSPVLNFLVSTYVHHWSPDLDSPETKRTRARCAPPEFLFAVIEGQASRIRNLGGGSQSVDRKINRSITEAEPPCCGDVCEFHEHESMEEQAATCGVADESKERLEIEIDDSYRDTDSDQDTDSDR